jgi:hypothetical protein
VPGPESRPSDERHLLPADLLLERRAGTRAADWYDREARQVAATVEPGDEVFEVGAAVAGLTAALAARAGWVFAAARDEVELSALRRALDPVCPRNVTFGPSHTIRSWCPRPAVVVAGDWSPQTDDPDAELSDLLGLAGRTLVVTSWRPAGDRHVGGSIGGADRALEVARRHGLEVRSFSTPVGCTRLRTVVAVSRA